MSTVDDVVSSVTALQERVQALLQAVLTSGTVKGTYASLAAANAALPGLAEQTAVWVLADETVPGTMAWYRKVGGALQLVSRQYLQGSTDAAIVAAKDRANHTGTQAIATVSGLPEELAGKQAALVKPLHGGASFGVNADTMESNSTGFAYSTGGSVPWSGPVARFNSDGNSGGRYDMWLTTSYQLSYLAAIRTRNGDANTISPWHRLAMHRTYDNWGTYGDAKDLVAGMLGWRGYGNTHVIIDSSAGTAPNGNIIDRVRPSIAIEAAVKDGTLIPTLMGCEVSGPTTYPVRVAISQALEQGIAYSNAIDDSYESTAIQLRETNFVRASTNINACAPRISAHWGGYASAQFGMDANGLWHTWGATTDSHSSLAVHDIVSLGGGWAGADGACRPTTDNASKLGSLVFRWSELHLATNPTVTSDARLKLDVTPSLGLDFVLGLNPVSYRIADAKVSTHVVDDGFEDVQEPECDEREIHETTVVIEGGRPVRKPTTRTERTQLYDMVALVDEAGQPITEPVLAMTSAAEPHSTPVVDDFGNQVVERWEPVMHPVPRMRNVRKPTTREVCSVGEGVRRHHGLLAQQVLEALEAAGLSGTDFAGLIRDDATDAWGLRYEQFIAPLISAVQTLAQRVEVLEERS